MSVIAEFTVKADDFALHHALTSAPDMIVEMERDGYNRTGSTHGRRKYDHFCTRNQWRMDAALALPNS